MDLLRAIADAHRSLDEAVRQTGSSRETSLVRTKLDEAQMWARRAAVAALESHPADFVAAVYGGEGD